MEKNETKKKEFFDFTANQEFNLDEEYKKLFNTEELIKVNPANKELADAEDIIKKEGPNYVEATTLANFENKLQNATEFFKKYGVETDTVKTMTRSDRDKLFGYGKELYNSLKEAYETIEFNFEMTPKEFAFLEHTMTKKLTYNGNEIFTYWELYSNWIEPTIRAAKQLPKDLPSFVPSIPVRQLVLLQHLIFKHEEKGSEQSFYSFRKIVFELAKMTKIFNAYGVLVVRVENRFKHWIDALGAMDGLNSDRDIDQDDLPPIPNPQEIKYS